MPTFTMPTGLELHLKPLPNHLRVKLVRRSQVAQSKQGEDRDTLQIKNLAELVEAGVNLDLTEVQKIAVQVYRHEFEREYPGVITRFSNKFVYIVSELAATDGLGGLADTIIALGPAPANKNPLAFFKRSGKQKK